MKLIHFALIFAINSLNAIAIPVIYDYDYESWRNSNYQNQRWNPSSHEHHRPQMLSQQRRYRETVPNQMVQQMMSNAEKPRSVVVVDMPKIEIRQEYGPPMQTMQPPPPMMMMEMGTLGDAEMPMSNAEDPELRRQRISMMQKEFVNIQREQLEKSQKKKMSNFKKVQKEMMARDEILSKIPDFIEMPAILEQTTESPTTTTDMAESTTVTTMAERKMSKKMERMRKEMLGQVEDKPEVAKVKKSKKKSQKSVKQRLKEIAAVMEKRMDVDVDKSSESKETEEDIVPVLRALGLPDDFASGTTAKPKTKKAKSRKSNEKSVATTTTQSSESKEESSEEGDDEEDEEEERSDPVQPTFRPIFPPFVRAKSKSSKTNKPVIVAQRKNPKTKSSKSIAQEQQASRDSDAGSGGTSVTYGEPPYGPDNPGPGDYILKDAKWRGVVKGSSAGQILRMMLNIPSKSISILKPLVVGTLDTGGQAGEALGTIMETASRELPYVYAQAGAKTHEMMTKVGAVKGGVLSVGGGLVTTAANVKNSLSGTLPLVFDGLGDMIGSLTGQVGSLIDFVSGVNDLASEGIIKAGRAGGNLITGFVEGKKEQGKGTLDGIKYGLNNEPVPNHNTYVNKHKSYYY